MRIDSYEDALGVFRRGEPCFSTSHKTRATKPQYIVNGDVEYRPACGDHLARAVAEVSQLSGLHMVHVWIRP